MRDNPIKRRLQDGGTAAGAMVFELLAPGLPQICSNAGADFLLYDMEHTGLGFETLKTQIALCRGLDLVPMTRVPRGEYHFIARALDRPVILSYLIVVVCMFVSLNLFVDILYKFLDPRVRLEGTP